MKEPSVDILLGAYNGEKYIQAQIESVLNQSHKNLRLIIRDDCSQDSTLEIIKKWKESHPEKIVIIPSEDRQGAKGNFSALMRHAQSPYVMFCDQDDVWMEGKVSKSMALMQRMEEQYGTVQPCLVHTDLKVVDQDLRPVSDSFWQYARLFPRQGGGFTRILMQNVVTGCTALMNRSLFDLMQKIPPEALMHDWWAALVASAFGRIGALPEPTVLYRQHAKNVLGAQKFGTAAHIKKAWKTLRGKRMPSKAGARVLCALSSTFGRRQQSNFTGVSFPSNLQLA